MPEPIAASRAVATQSRGAPMHGAYRLGWAAIIAGIPCAAAIVLATGMSLAPRSMVPLASCLALLGGAHLRYRFFQPEARLALATGALAMLASAGLIAGIVSHIGLRLRRPLIDDLLVAADRTLNVDASRAALAMVDYPAVLGILDMAYASSLPLCFAVVLILAVCEKAERTWEAAASFALCIIVAGLFGALYPALGSFSHAGLGTEHTPGLPANAGVFHLPAFDALYRGFDPVFDLAMLNGVVTFPSFHMAMALICAWAMRGLGWLSWATAAWCGAIAVSTIPIGGHYIVDLIGGLVLWALAIIAIRLISLSESRGDASVTMRPGAPGASLRRPALRDRA